MPTPSPAAKAAPIERARNPARRPAGSVVLAPVSATAAELLHALYADAFAAAAAAVNAPPPGSIVLREPPTSGLTATYQDNAGYRSLRLNQGFEYEISLQTPFLGDPRFEWHRPGVWYGSEERKDMQGRRWKGSLPCRYVIDNFGDLVEVQQ
jgi:hypothetical protein